MFKTVIAISLLMTLGLSAAWRVNGEAPVASGYTLSAHFGSFYTDGVMNPMSSGILLPFAYYKMDDCSGAATVLDSSGNGRNTVHPYGNTVNYSAAGVKGTALWTVPGSGGFPVHDDITAILYADFSFAAWMKLDGPEAYSPIFYTPENSSYCFSMINYGGGYMLCDFGGGGASFPVDLFPSWHHVVFAKSGSTVTVYYDGASLGSLAVGEHYSTSWKLFDSAWGGYNSALSDEIIFFSRALTGQQVTELYESYEGRPQYVQAAFDTGYFQVEMGISGACDLEYSSRKCVIGESLNTWPVIVNHNPLFDLVGWADANGELLEVSLGPTLGNHEFHAVWTANYADGSLGFDLQGGTGDVPYSFYCFYDWPYETAYAGNVWPQDPTYEGYVFSGWWNGVNGTGTQLTPGTVYTPDLGMMGTAYAYWTLPPITFTFNSGVPPYGGGTAQTDIPGIENYVTYDYTEINYGPGAEIAAIPSASVTGPRYTFTGYWYEPYYAVVYQIGSYAPLNNYPFGGPIPLYAMWTDNGYQGELFFDLQGGIGDAPSKKLYTQQWFACGDFGEECWPWPPTYEGLEFLGWYTQPGGGGTQIEINTTWDAMLFPVSMTVYAYFNTTDP